MSFRKAIVVFSFLLFAFIVPFGDMSVHAENLALSAAGQVVPLSQSFHSPLLKGIKVYPRNPLRFDFILDKGQSSDTDEQLQSDANRLLRYFLTSLTISDKDLWVNLSPYEKDRIIPDFFGKTEMGRDLLAQDYLLKQIVASATHPDGTIGAKFWQEVYARIFQKYGTTDIPMDMFNKVWIVPDKAVILVNHQAGVAYVKESSFKVMLDKDYFATQKHADVQVSRENSQSDDVSDIAKELMRSVVIPALEREVNEGKNFARLRQVYHSLILAGWYKKAMKGSLLSQIYVDQDKTVGLQIPDPSEIERLWDQYVDVFKQGVYSITREEFDLATQEMVPRKYFSGGMDLRSSSATVTETEVASSGDLSKNEDSSTYLVAVDVSSAGAGVSAAASPTEMVLLPPMAQTPDVVGYYTRDEYLKDSRLHQVNYTVTGQVNMTPNSQAAAIFERIEEFDTVDIRLAEILNNDQLTLGDLQKGLAVLRHMFVLYLNVFENFPQDLQQFSEEEIVNKALDSNNKNIQNLAKVYGRIVGQINDDLLTDSQLSLLVPAAAIQQLRDMAKDQDGKLVNKELINKDAQYFTDQEMAGISLNAFINIIHQKGLDHINTVFSRTSSEPHMTSSLKVRIAAVAEQSVLDNPNVTTSVELNIPYIDARHELSESPPLLMRYIAMAFAQGRLLTDFPVTFNPSKAKIICSERKAWLSLPLGQHSATVSVSLKPLRDGGGIFVYYKEGDETLLGSTIRSRALRAAFKEEGFAINREGFFLEAAYNKEKKTNGIFQLPDRLHFALQVLSGILNMDTGVRAYIRRNENARDVSLHEDNYVARYAALYADIIRDQGFVYRRKNGFFTEHPVIDPIPADESERIRADAYILGLPANKNDVNLRLLRRVEEEKDLLRQRGALVETEDDWRINLAYQQAMQESPISFVLQHLSMENETTLPQAQLMAQIASLAKIYAVQIKVAGYLGKYEVSRVVLNTLGERITFYLLTDTALGQPVLAYAVLGDAYFDSPRNDFLRQKRLDNNLLSLTDVVELVSMSGLENVLPAQHAAFIGFLTREEKKLQENAMAAFILKQARKNSQAKSEDSDQRFLELDWESMQQLASDAMILSSYYADGNKVYPKAAFGRAAFKRAGRTAEAFKDRILISDALEAADDDFIRAAQGIVTTQGGTGSHAQIRAKQFQKASLILKNAPFDGRSVSLKMNHRVLSERQEKVGDKTVMVQEYYGSGQIRVSIEEDDIIYLDGRSGRLFLVAKSDDEAAQSVMDAYDLWRENPSAQGLLEIINLPGAIPLVKSIVRDVFLGKYLDERQIRTVMDKLIEKNGQVGVVLNSFFLGMGEDFYANVNNAAQRLSQHMSLSDSPDGIQQLLLDVNALMTEAAQAKRFLVSMGKRWKGQWTAEQIDVQVANIMSLAKSKLEFYQSQLMEISSNPQKLGDVRSLVDLRNQMRMVGLELQGEAAEKLQRQLNDLNAQIVAKFGSQRIIWKNELEDYAKGSFGLSDRSDGIRQIAGGKAAEVIEIMNAITKLKKQGIIAGNTDIANPEGFIINPSEYQLWSQNGQGQELSKDLISLLKSNYEKLISIQIEDIKKILSSADPANPVLVKISQIIQQQGSDIVGLRLSLSEYLDGLQDSGFVPDFLLDRLRSLGIVAIRSTGLTEDTMEISSAGKYETVLGALNFEQLLEAVRKVWASGAEGVIVEEMIWARQSVLAFSADDVSADVGQMRMTVAEGLNAGLVAQTVVDPDSYVIRKSSTGRTAEIIDSKRHVGEKREKVVIDFREGGIKVEEGKPLMRPALNDDKILLVVNVLQALSDYLHVQIDGELSYDASGRLYFLQGRPVTTLNEYLAQGLKFLTQASSSSVAEYGGIDLGTTAGKVEIQTDGHDIEFSLDPKVLEELRQATGFIPRIISFEPVSDFVKFWDSPQLQNSPGAGSLQIIR